MLLVITLIGAFLRFYNLMWGNGNFFHPDENNMARSISQMTVTNKLYPDFFAYGQFPLYLSYFLNQFLYLGTNVLMHTKLTGEFPFYQIDNNDAIFGLRFFAALFSTLTIPLTYLVIKEVIKKESQTNLKSSIKQLFNMSDSASFYPLMGGLLVAFLPGLIQSSHFGTTESMLTFFFLLLTYLSLRILRHEKNIVKNVVQVGLGLGLALGTKITAAFFFLPPVLAILFSSPTKSHSIFKTSLIKGLYISIVVVLAGLFFFLSSPYSLLDWEHFHGTSQYESDVALGKSPVFYTRQFINTVPLVFQLQHVFPFVLGPGVYVAGIISLFLLPFLISKTGNRLLYKQYVVLTISFLFFLLPNSFLFVKWTRFLTPLFPFMAIFVAWGFFLSESLIKKTAIVRALLICVILVTIASGLNFFSVYANNDVRYTASEWVYSHVPKNSYILFDTGNVVDIPVHVENQDNFNYTSISFDFYHLNEEERLPSELVDHLVKADYIFLPSRRIFANHMRVPSQFPLANRYYTALFDGTLGFQPIAVISTHGIQRFNRLTSSSFIEDEDAEETWTVFDHPIVRIYKKIEPHDEKYYEEILNIPVQ